MRKLTRRMFSYLAVFIVFLLTACTQETPLELYKYTKVTGTNDFTYPGNMVSADLTIDGILDEEEWFLESTFTTYYAADNRIMVKIYWGDKGITVGWVANDPYISASTNYNDEIFVINSDNVEFFIDTLNNGGPKCQEDDYQFNINPEGYAMLQVGGLAWGSWSGVVDYAVYVKGTINDDSDIDEYWSVELFLPYETFGFTKDSTIGIAFGARNKMTHERYSDWRGWSLVPDPQIIDTYIPLTKDGIQIGQVEGYESNSGTFEITDEKIVSKRNNSIAIKRGASLTTGTISVDMVPNSNTDNGIVFNIDAPDNSFFWEDNVRYYFFFINMHGDAHLGKVANGWKDLGISKLPNYNPLNKYNLKVVLSNNTIYCYVDDVLYITYKDDEYINASKLGLRAGGLNVEYTNFTYSNDVPDDISGEVQGYHVVSGIFKQQNGAIISVSGSALAVKEISTFTSGTFSAHVKAKTASDNGIIFGLTNNGLSSYWEVGVSYYFFFVSRDGTAYLGKVSNGWSELHNVPISDYSINNTYKLTVEWDGTTINCYVDDELYFTYTDSNPLTGNRYGIRAGTPEVEFTNITIG